MSLLNQVVSWGCRGGVLLLLAGWVSLAGAQPARDPTRSPAAASSSVVTGIQPGTTLGSNGIAVLVRGGVRYLVLGTRLYAKDQTIGQARIVRITETEVWLREAGQLKKIPVFSGIERRAVKPEGNHEVLSHETK